MRRDRTHAKIISARARQASNDGKETGFQKVPPRGRFTMHRRERAVPACGGCGVSLGERWRGQPMTEEEWLAGFEPSAMLVFEEHRSAERKLRLFACACVYRVWDRVEDARCRHGVSIAERLADGLVNEEERKVALQAVQAAFRDTSPTLGSEAEDAILAARYTLVRSALICFAAANRAASCLGSGKATEQATQAVLLRDIFGNPFRSVAVDPSWLTSTVVALAEGIYQERAFDRMPILADALQDAGCDNDDVLNHCRQPGEHVRGCWVVDLLTGRK